MSRFFYMVFHAHFKDLLSHVAKKHNKSIHQLMTEGIEDLMALISLNVRDDVVNTLPPWEKQHFLNAKKKRLSFPKDKPFIKSIVNAH